MWRSDARVLIFFSVPGFVIFPPYAAVQDKVSSLSSFPESLKSDRWFCLVVFGRDGVVHLGEDSPAR